MQNKCTGFQKGCDSICQRLLISTELSTNITWTFDANISHVFSDEDVNIDLFKAKELRSSIETSTVIQNHKFLMLFVSNFYRSYPVENKLVLFLLLQNF